MEANKFKNYGAKQIQQQCRNSAGLGLAELGPARPGPGLARLDLPGLSSAWPGPGRRSSTRLPSVQLSSARLGPARPGQAAHHPSELFRPNYGKYKLIAHRHIDFHKVSAHNDPCGTNLL